MATPPPLSFVINALNTSVVSASATISGTGETALTGYNATANVSVPISYLYNAFQFWTDGSDVTDTDTDIQYKFVYDASTTTGYQCLGHIDLNGNAYVAASGALAPNNANAVNQMKPAANVTDPTNTVAFDYPRFLAYKLFGDVNGVDLFNNENSLRTALQTNFLTAYNIVTDALTRDVTNSTTDASAITASITKTVFQQLISTQTGADRLDNIVPLLVLGQTLTAGDAGAGAWYYVPIEIGDSFEFKVTIDAATSQEALTGMGTDAIEPHVYRIIMNVAANPST